MRSVKMDIYLLFKVVFKPLLKPLPHLFNLRCLPFGDGHCVGQVKHVWFEPKVAFILFSLLEALLFP